MANRPAPLPSTTSGPIHQVPCPHCGKPNDFRALKSQQLIDTGHQMYCDHCGRSMEVVRIATVEVVSVRRDPSGKVAPQLRAAEQRQQQQRQMTAGKPGIMQRLLGKG